MVWVVPRTVSAEIRSCGHLLDTFRVMEIQPAVDADAMLCFHVDAHTQASDTGRSGEAFAPAMPVSVSCPALCLQDESIVRGFQPRHVHCAWKIYVLSPEVRSQKFPLHRIANPTLQEGPLRT